MKVQIQKRQAYDIVIRQLSNGSDYNLRLFARDEHEAGRIAMDRVRFFIGMSRSKYDDLNAKGISAFRVVSCAVSADQSRPSA